MSTAFLIGAGFNADAAAELGLIAKASYPLTSDLLRPCFGLDALPPKLSVEDLFGRALDERNLDPIRVLSDLLMDADGDVAFHLRQGAGRDDNAYLTFLRHFEASHFLTFNYDSLVEILLLSLGRWRPDNGFGTPVRIELPLYPPTLPDRSTNLVLHLHGSLCVYPEKYGLVPGPTRNYEMLVTRGAPLFAFDPEAIGYCFFPFQAAFPEGRYHYLDERIIAPIPNKAQGLADVFVTEVYRRGAEVLQQVDLLVVVGYRFSPYDRYSYEPLVGGTSLRRILVVAPDASDLAKRLRTDYPIFNWDSAPYTFSKWVRAGYPGV